MMALLALPPVVPAFELTAATQGMSKGTLQSDGVQFIPRFTLKAKPFQLGMQWKNLSTNNASGEASAFAGWSGKVAAIDLAASVAYKALTSAHGAGNRRSWEFAGTASRKLGPVGLKASIVFSPDDFGGTKQSWFVEAGPSVDLPLAIKASGALGRRHRINNRDYTAFNVGLSRTFAKHATADVRYYDTDKGNFGEAYDRRVVGSVKLAF